ncbi:hypothetical protein NPIL_442081, partial [Nephila pilipes]
MRTAGRLRRTRGRHSAGVPPTSFILRPE